MELKAPIATEAGHWYSTTGEPTYTITGKNGKERATTLRDARTMNLLPSVTTILRCADKPGLTRWLQQQVLLAALTLPQQEGESLDAYAERVIKDANEQSKKAMELGTSIHTAIERNWLCLPYDETFKEHVSGAVEAITGWCGVDGIKPEKSFAHRAGFGGKCDLHKEGFVADYKSKDFTSDKLPDTYEEHAMQLAAYREGFGMPDARCAIVYVSTKEPGLTHLVELKQDELQRGWDMFKSLLSFWQFKNKYIPS